MARCSRTFMQVSVNFVQTVLVVDALMRREQQLFSVEDFMRMYNVLRPKFDPTNGLYTKKKCLRLRSNKEPQIRLVMENPNKDVFLYEFV